jgi:hypothetical protein
MITAARASCAYECVVIFAHTAFALRVTHFHRGHSHVGRTFHLTLARAAHEQHHAASLARDSAHGYVDRGIFLFEEAT